MQSSRNILLNHSCITQVNSHTKVSSLATTMDHFVNCQELSWLKSNVPGHCQQPFLDTRVVWTSLCLGHRRSRSQGSHATREWRGVYVWMRVCGCACNFARSWCVSIYGYIHMYVYVMYIYLYVNVYILICICMYMYMYIHTSTHTYTSRTETCVRCFNRENFAQKMVLPAHEKKDRETEDAWIFKSVTGNIVNDNPVLKLRFALENWWGGVVQIPSILCLTCCWVADGVKSQLRSWFQ